MVAGIDDEGENDTISEDRRRSWSFTCTLPLVENRFWFLLAMHPDRAQLIK
jgi:hypothetical protein